MLTCRLVVYLLAADNVLGPLSFRLSDILLELEVSKASTAIVTDVDHSTLYHFIRYTLPWACKQVI